LDGTRRVPLTYLNGEHLREKDTDPTEIKQAYQRWQTAQLAARAAAEIAQAG
jgi:hypothetical protein